MIDYNILDHFQRVIKDELNLKDKNLKKSWSVLLNFMPQKKRLKALFLLKK